MWRAAILGVTALALGSGVAWADPEIFQYMTKSEIAEVRDMAQQIGMSVDDMFDANGEFTPEAQKKIMALEGSDGSAVSDENAELIADAEQTIRDHTAAMAAQGLPPMESVLSAMEKSIRDLGGTPPPRPAAAPAATPTPDATPVTAPPPPPAKPLTLADMKARMGEIRPENEIIAIVSNGFPDNYALFKDGVATNCSEFDPTIAREAHGERFEGCFERRWEKTGKGYRVIPKDPSYAWDLEEELLELPAGSKLDLDFHTVSAAGSIITRGNVRMTSAGEIETDMARNLSIIHEIPGVGGEYAGAVTVGASSEDAGKGRYYIDGHYLLLATPSGRTSFHTVAWTPYDGKPATLDNIIYLHFDRDAFWEKDD